MSYFKAKMHQIRFRLTALPRPPAGFKGPTSNGREGRGGWTGGKGKRGERERKGEKEREGEERKGEGRWRVLPSVPQFQICHYTTGCHVRWHSVPVWISSTLLCGQSVNQSFMIITLTSRNRTTRLWIDSCDTGKNWPPHRLTFSYTPYTRTD